jgi:hypothetical protein
MAGVYRPRDPEKTDRFQAEYESRFWREYGFFRLIVKEVVEPVDCR